ncbi:MAG: hypothetical protein P4L40_18560, partial [Terracidiphilus sp.]|nr:hypothetical protein [Terracidiphilus sp.]
GYVSLCLLQERAGLNERVAALTAELTRAQTAHAAEKSAWDNKRVMMEGVVSRASDDIVTLRGQLQVCV